MEEQFENHIVNYLVSVHDYKKLTTADCTDKDFHIVQSHLFSFITETQKENYAQLKENYSTDTEREIFRALKDELNKKPLWVIIRNGLSVRGIKFDLYFPKPRQNSSQVSWENYRKNIFAVKQQYHFSTDNQYSIDVVLFLNGLPVITIELKHENCGQNVHNAVSQYISRPEGNRIFSLPFLHVAADTSEVKIATNPRVENNFIPFNEGLVNEEETEGEYPIEFFYKNALSKDWILEYLNFFLLYIPVEVVITDYGVTDVKPERTIFPRYHQLRTNKQLPEDVTGFFEEQKKLGKKYLINHSAGSGKTLTISWLTDKLDSLYASNNQKVFDMVIVLTDRRSLDKNIKDELTHFVHLKNKIGFAKKGRNLKQYLINRKSIIVTTIQKFNRIQEIINEDEGLKQCRVAFIIDEAHRSQDGKMANNVRAFFTPENQPDEENIPTDEDEIIDTASQVDISNQVLIAFTATPSQSTVDYFGEPFDEYTEDEAIKEGYIKDVAQNIVSYETLYHLKSKTLIPDENLYPAGIVHKALQNVAFRDPELIQYKSEVILKYFDDKIKDSLHGTGKAMVVASSRPAGLLYFQALKEKIEKRNLPFKILFAFSDFTDQNGNEIKEETINELDTIHGGEKIEDVFDKDEYRIIVVANKFQAGFNQPKLIAMFLDKPVRGANAVQTLSRLNRNYPDKDNTMVVDFTNSVQNIFTAFRQYRRGTNYEPREPDPQTLEDNYNRFMNQEIFNEQEIVAFTKLVKETTADPEKDSELMALSNIYRNKFREKIEDKERQKEIVNLLNRYVSDFYFISLFFQIPDKLVRFALFAEVIADKLIKKGSYSKLQEHIKSLLVEKSAVRYRGIISAPNTLNEAPRERFRGTRPNTPPPRQTISEVMEDLKNRFQISDEEALLINEVIEVLMKDETVVSRIINHINDELYLNNYKGILIQRVKNYYSAHNWEERLIEGPYVNPGGIIEYIVQSVIGMAEAQAS